MRRPLSRVAGTAMERNMHFLRNGLMVGATVGLLAAMSVPASAEMANAALKDKKDTLFFDAATTQLRAELHQRHRILVEVREDPEVGGCRHSFAGYEARNPAIMPATM